MYWLTIVLCACCSILPMKIGCTKPYSKKTSKRSYGTTAGDRLTAWVSTSSLIWLNMKSRPLRDRRCIPPRWQIFCYTWNICSCVRFMPVVNQESYAMGGEEYRKFLANLKPVSDLPAEVSTLWIFWFHHQNGDNDIDPVVYVCQSFKKNIGGLAQRRCRIPG